ncbi:MAG: Maf family protein [Anaerolineales bacterium]|nr:Maf family protein [Anaerolineales bacterium]
MTEFILASKSPRRQMLLRNLINHFIVMETDIDETIQPGEDPADFVLRLASEKAFAAGKRLAESTLQDVVVIAADTIVVDKEKVLGKPIDAADAKNILGRLKNRTHQVLSGIAVYQLKTGKIRSNMVLTEVRMRNYTETEVQEYVNSGDPFDKAGAYAIQNDSFNPAPDFEGCFANVMGLPLCHLSLLLKKENLELDSRVAARCQESIRYQCPVYSQILTGENEQ